MGFLQRSKSAAIVEQNNRWKKDEAVPEHPNIPTTDGVQKKSMSQERPKTADDRRSRSFSRPRTATCATKAMDRGADLQIPGQPIEIKAGDEVFNFPTPSPRLPPKSATFQTFQPAPSSLKLSESPAIGVALGSPTQATMPKQVPMPSWGRSFTADHISNRMPVNPPPARTPPAIPEQAETDVQKSALRQKKSSWKKFGALFGRKAAKPVAEEPFYKLKVPQDHDRFKTQLHPDFPTPEPSPLPNRVHRRTPSMTRGMARFEARAEADLASFMPDGKARKMRSPSMIQKDGFSPMFRALNYPRDSEDMFRTVLEERTDSPLSMDEKTELGATPSTPRLDLDLPDPKFERYSVMFEKLLDEPRPSLLERRQSKLQRKKSVKTLDPVSAAGEEGETPRLVINGVPQRSATAPQLQKSLSINVGKKMHSAGTATDESGTALHRPRPIQRSKTAPPNAVSPLAQTFARAKTAMMGRSPRSPGIENEIPETPMTIATVSDSDSVAIINNEIGTLHRKMDQAEPSWDMITSEPAKVDSERRPDPYRRVKSPEDLERQIVQVSVARQVSVSKARRQVQQAVASKQALRPRVVEVSKDRKSTVVLIESGDD